MTSRVSWREAPHERAVERFYSKGVHHRTEIHDGYLNFGLWEEGVEHYVEAAEALVHRLATWGALGPGSRLLDVGCGMGTQDVYLQRTFGPLEIDGLDVTWGHVERAARRARDAGVAGRVRFHHGTATAPPFPDGHFTHVLGIEGPVHFLTRREFFDEAFRVLRPGGVLLLADYALARWPRTPIERGVFDVARRLWRVPAANVCDVEGYRRQLGEAGFAAVEIRRVGSSTIPGYVREQRRADFRREMERLQGVWLSRVGRIINVAMARAYRLGLLEYLLVRATRPGACEPSAEVR